MTYPFGVGHSRGDTPPRQWAVALVLGACLLAVGIAAPTGTAATAQPATSPGAAQPGDPVVLAPVDTLKPGSGIPLVPKATRKAVLADLRPIPGSVAALVVDVASGEVLVADNSARPAIPASTMKLVTALTALQTLGPDDVLRTRTVLQGGEESPTVVIVGAGDAMLTSGRGTIGGPGSLAHPASTEELAANTARALALRGVTKAKVAYDNSLFVGPDMSPDWQASFPASGVVAPVSALMVDEGRRTPNSFARSNDPALVAAQTFARQLEDAGITVTGQEPREVRAKEDAELVAFVDSPTIGSQVERLLATSNNDIGEALFRLAAIATGREGSFTGGARTAKAVMKGADLDLSGVVVRDGSGLSRRNRLTPDVLTELLRATAQSTGSAPVGQSEGAQDAQSEGVQDGQAADSQTPGGGEEVADPDPQRISAIFSGLPVAGATGSLRMRFHAAGERDGRGMVRAKTGTLTGVITLAGFASRADGRLLAFAYMADEVGSAPAAARAGVDKAAAALVGCDCQVPQE